jgi:hypothetical protein
MRWMRASLTAAGLAAASLASCSPLATPVASYRIQCRYDEPKKRIEGSELIDWRNTSSRPVSTLAFHLYLNAFSNNRSSYMRERRKFGEHAEAAPGQWGSISISRMTSAVGDDLMQGFRFIAPDDGNADDRTVAEVALDSPVPPGATVRISVEFVVQLPHVIDRSGYAGDFALVAQWFPKIGVLSDDGWNCHQYHANSEFFADFGDYDVTIDAPRRLKGKIGGTGRLVEERDAAGERILAHFRQESVHDFAWTADPAFLVESENVRVAGLPDVTVTLLLQPEHRALRARYFGAAATAIAACGRLYGPYPYGILTLVDPPADAKEAWGMEYPTFISCGASLWTPRSAWQEFESLEGTVIHEFAHQYFYGMLASNEFEEAWLDEGFARYTEVRVASESEGDAHPVVSIFGFPVVLRSVALHAPLDTQLKTFAAVGKDPLTASWKFESPQNYGLVYGKMALALSTMERLVGRPVMDRLLKTYATEFRFRHPVTGDFLAVARRVTGRDWTKFFDRAVLAAGTLDYAVARAESRPAAPPAGWIETAGRATEVSPPASDGEKGPYETDVLVERRGSVVVPVEIRLDFAGKKSYATTWDGEAPWIRLHVEAGPRLLRALVDPEEKLLLDANRNNNGRVLRGDAAAANLWTARAFFWTENALDLFMELW